MKDAPPWLLAITGMVLGAAIFAAAAKGVGRSAQRSDPYTWSSSASRSSPSS